MISEEMEAECGECGEELVYVDYSLRTFVTGHKLWKVRCMNEECECYYIRNGMLMCDNEKMAKITDASYIGG